MTRDPDDLGVDCMSGDIFSVFSYWAKCGSRKRKVGAGLRHARGSAPRFSSFVLDDMRATAEQAVTQEFYLSNSLGKTSHDLIEGKRSALA